jgi:uroporphyrinogen-III synthase
MLGGTAQLERPLIACIGPITADTARQLGLRVDVMAAEYTVEGLVEALKEFVPPHA